MTRASALVLAALALGVAGCGGSDNKSSSSSSSSSSAPASSSSSSSSGSAASSGGKVAVKMQGFQFSPKTQNVKVGQTVTWTNADSAVHNVTAQSGGSFKSKDFGQGASYSFKPTKAGTIQYVCTLHPGMSATLNVQ